MTKKTDKAISEAASLMGKKGGAKRKKQIGIEGLRKQGSKGGIARAKNLRKLSPVKSK